MTSSGGINRNLTAISGDKLYMYILDDDHVLDYPFYATTTSVLGYAYNAFYLTVAGNYNYDPATAQFTASMGTGHYSTINLTGMLMPDSRVYNTNYGSRDVFAEIRVVEILQGNDIAANISNSRLYVKTSVNRQFVATGSKGLNTIEVPTSVFLYEDNSNIRSYSETNYMTEGYNYQESADVHVLTDPDDLRVGPVKNFFVHDFPLDSVLGKSFSFELNMNSEGTLYDAKLEIANRKENGNAS